MQKGRCLPPCQLRATAFGIRIIESFFFFEGERGKEALAVASLMAINLAAVA